MPEAHVLDRRIRLLCVRVSALAGRDESGFVEPVPVELPFDAASE